MESQILAQNIEALCSAKNVTTNAMLSECELKKDVINNMKKEKPSKPSVETVAKIAEYFNVSIDSLVYGEKNEYSDCYVAFFDILGFSRFINNNSFEIVKHFFDTIDKVRANAANKTLSAMFTKEELLNVKYCFLSDSIVLSIKKNVPRSLNILIFLTNTMVSNIMLECNFIVRGAITSGNHFISENTVFGSALVKAAKLEKSSAKNPRIIIEPQILDEYKASIKNDPKLSDLIIRLEKYITKDEIMNDNYYILNYIKYFLHMYNNLPKIKKNVDIFIEHINNELSNEKNSDVYSKLLYFAKSFNFESQRYNYSIEALKNPVVLINIVNQDTPVINKSKGIYNQLSDDKQRLLSMYDLLNDREQGLVMGYLTRVSEEHKNSAAEKGA